MKQYLLRNKVVIFVTYVSLCALLATMTILVLFFLWYPDFIGWLSNKIPDSGFLGYIPLVVLIGGLSLGLFPIFLALSKWREITVKRR